MLRETIAVDIDDVLAAHIEAFVACSNKHHGTDLLPRAYSEDWSSLWGVDKEEVEIRAKGFHRLGLNNFGVIEDAEEVLKELKKSYRLVIVTGRRENVLALTQKWLKRYFSGVFEEVHFVPLWEPDNKVTKADICRKIGANYLIDDLMRHCNLAAESGITALLFERHKWNQKEKLNPAVIKVKNWQEVMDYFDEKG